MKEYYEAYVRRFGASDADAARWAMRLAMGDLQRAARHCGLVNSRWVADQLQALADSALVVTGIACVPRHEWPDADALDVFSVMEEPVTVPLAVTMHLPDGDVVVSYDLEIFPAG